MEYFPLLHTVRKHFINFTFYSFWRVMSGILYTLLLITVTGIKTVWVEAYMHIFVKRKWVGVEHGKGYPLSL